MITEILSKIFDVIINRVALPIAILCSILLFMPKSILEQIEVLPIVNSFRGVIWIIFLFSFLIYGYEKGKSLINKYKKKIEINKKEATYKNRIITAVQNKIEEGRKI
jgi:hypothetical protein